MKVFNLRCSQDHRFEGWFASSAEFDAQVSSGLLRCPLCEDGHIDRMPSAPHLNLRTEASHGHSTAEVSVPTPSTLQANHAMQVVLMKAVLEVIKHTEDVGDRFAEEARKIHYRETAERGIRGVASESECRELEEEGIDVIRVPIKLRGNEPLQ